MENKNNIIQVLHLIECDIVCYGAPKAIWTKEKGRVQYCFSVLHNTSYCTK